MADELPGDVIHECQDAFSSVAGGLEEIIRANQVRSRPVIGYWNTVLMSHWLTTTATSR